MKDAFISYNHRDEHIKHIVCTIFDAAGISYYVDDRDLSYGQSIVEGVMAGIDDARFTILLVSEHSMKSTWVARETMRRLNRNGDIICILIQNEVLEAGFHARLQEHFNVQIAELVAERDKILAQGGVTSTIDALIVSIQSVRINELIDTVQERLAVRWANQDTRVVEMLRLIQQMVARRTAVQDDAMPPRDWPSLIEAIKEGSAMLVLGPEATINYKGIRRQDALFRLLAAQNPGSGGAGVKYHERDGLLIFQDNVRGRIAHQPKIKQFYDGIALDNELRRLVAIPFPLVVTTTPDSSYQNACTKNQITFSHTYATAPLQNGPFSGIAPLVYSLLGSVEDMQQVVLTHPNMYRLMKQVLDSNTLHQVIKSVFAERKVKYVVLLGFEFDHWYLQLILYALLGLPDGLADGIPALTNAVTPAIGLHRPEVDNEVLFEHYFRIDFVHSKLADFVEALYDQLGPAYLRCLIP